MNNHDLNNLKVCIQRKYDIIWQEANTCFYDMYIPGSKDLYPYLVYQIQGLEPEKLYNMTLHFERSDGSRWEDRGDKYYPSGPANAPLMSNTVWHELGPRSGKFWMTLGCSFMFLRVTCKIDCVLPPNTISLRLFHKYIPVLSIYMWPNNKSIRFPPATFRIAHTEFLAAPSPTKNERLSMLTKIRRKKNFTIREKIRSDGKDKPTIYATCRVEHYLTHAQEISTQPLWITVNKHPYLLQSDFNSFIHDDKDTDISEQECPILQVEGDSNSSVHDKNLDISSETEQECPNLLAEVDSIHDNDSDISGDLDQECPLLQVEDNVAGKPTVNGFTSPVPQVNMESGGNQGRIKFENLESPQTDSPHQLDNDAGELIVNRFTSTISQVNMEAEGNQERIKIENPESPPQTDSRHPPDDVVSEPTVNGFISPVSQVNMESEQTQRRIKIEIPESPQADSRHLQDNVVGEQHVNCFTSPVPQVNMESVENQERINIENPESPQTVSRHPPEIDASEQQVSCFSSPIPQVNMNTEVSRVRFKNENPESPQIDSHQEHSPVPELTMETEETPRRIKLESPSSPPSDSRHQPDKCFQDTVSGEPVVNVCTSPVLQKKRKSVEPQERIKIENPESPPQSDSRHQPVQTRPIATLRVPSAISLSPTVRESEIAYTTRRVAMDNIVGEPPVNGHVLQKKRRTGEIGSHHTDLPVFPCAFFPQHQPIQTPNFANFPHFGMEPNLNHPAFYSQLNSFMMPNYRNSHSLNHRVFPSANGFTFPNPNPFMTNYPNRFFPTTFNYSAYQNMPPNYQFPIDFPAPLPSLRNGSYPFCQPTPDNSAWGNFPNPGRFF